MVVGQEGGRLFFFNHITFYTFVILSHVNVLLTDQNIQIISQTPRDVVTGMRSYQQTSSLELGFQISC